MAAIHSIRRPSQTAEKDPPRSNATRRVKQELLSLLFRERPALADDLWLCHFNKGHTDAGAEQLQGDFLTVAEFDSIAIGAMFEPCEGDVFLVPDAKPRLQIARDAFELEVRIILKRRLRSCNRRVRRGQCFPMESGW